MVLHEPLGHIDFTIDNQSPVRVLRDPMTDKRIDVPKVEPQVPGPLGWDVEWVDDVSRSVPALLIDHALSSSPQATAQPQIAHACQRVQDGDIARALSRHHAIRIEEERIIFMARLKQQEITSSSALLNPVRWRTMVHVANDLRIRVLAITQPGRE